MLLTGHYPCLFTFSDKEENQRAHSVLAAFQAHFVAMHGNQFSSLLLKQATNRPNHVQAVNSFAMIIKGFTTDDHHDNENKKDLHEQEATEAARYPAKISAGE